MQHTLIPAVPLTLGLILLACGGVSSATYTVAPDGSDGNAGTT